MAAGRNRPHALGVEQAKVDALNRLDATLTRMLAAMLDVRDAVRGRIQEASSDKSLKTTKDPLPGGVILNDEIADDVRDKLRKKHQQTTKGR